MNEVIKKINVDGVEYDIQGKELTKVTYAELKSLRDNGELVEGHLYRITDYEFTTVQADTKSAGHVFDIIVLATSANELSHIARAIAHDGDAYFDGNNLGAWELWYDLDNDTTKYEWADATNGKGVIYRMIDEKRNDCPYDFKNVLFFNDKLTTSTTEDKYYYTFSYVVSGVLYDGTVEKQVTKCYENSMGVYIKSNKRSLNRNVWRNDSFGDNCSSNTFGHTCFKNTFGDGCYNNTFGDGCSNNTFGNSCSSNTFGYNCTSNILGNSCTSNILGNSCSSNTFGNYCSNNTFGNNLYANTFGNSCSSNTFGYNCASNTFGNYCSYNTFGDKCSYNTFGDECRSNTFGDDCRNNTFGDGCSNNTFGSSVSNRKVDISKTSTTLNEEYYDDGSGQLVPIKHPDLSTQPSILPYKFMGNYVYEQLIPLSEEDVLELEAQEELTINIRDISGLTIHNLLLIESTVIIAWVYPSIDGYPSTLQPSTHPVAAYTSPGGVDEPQPCLLHIMSNGSILHSVTAKNTYSSYLRLVYTSLPEDSSYYEYENY